MHYPCQHEISHQYHGLPDERRRWRLAAPLASRVGIHRGPAHEADIFIVLTCSVREKPELKVASELGPGRIPAPQAPAFVAVGGCVAQQLGPGLWKRFPMVRPRLRRRRHLFRPPGHRRLAEDPRLRLSLLDFTATYPDANRAGQRTAFPPGPSSPSCRAATTSVPIGIVPFVRGRQNPGARPPYWPNAQGVWPPGRPGRSRCSGQQTSTVTVRTAAGRRHQLSAEHVARPGRHPGESARLTLHHLPSQ